MTETARHAAFITGSGRGIGLGTAIELARKSFNIALNDRKDDGALESARQAVAELGVKVVKVPGDVSVTTSHEAMLDRAEAEIGPVSTLVNNAGVSVLNRGDLLEATEESYDRCMVVNTKALFFLSQAFARRPVSRDRSDGRFYSLVNVTSANASSVAVQRGEYCASKAAAAMISKVFAVRLGGEGVAVYDIQPGLIETDMTRTVTGDYQRRIDNEGLTLFPRLGQPRDIGRVIATLATGGLPYTTGHVFSADAGMLVSGF